MKTKFLLFTMSFYLFFVNLTISQTTNVVGKYNGSSYNDSRIIDDATYVGINTTGNTTLAAGLHIFGTGAAASMNLERSETNAYGTQILFRSRKPSWGAVGSGILIGTIGFQGPITTTGTFATGALIQAVTTETWTNSANGAKLVFGTTDNGSASWTTKMTLDQNGYLGIGTAPLNRLDVEGGVVIGATWAGYHTAPTNGLTVEGKLGVAVSSSSEPFTVYSNGGDCYGTYGSSGWTHSSDSKLKTNIKPIINALDKVKLLNGVYFNWKRLPDSLTQIGFLAQEVEKVVPEVVVKNDGRYGMAYGNLTALLVEAMKEQQTTIETLESKVEEMQKIIGNIRTDKKESNYSKQGTNLELTQTTSMNVELTNKDDAILYQNEPNPFSENTIIRYFIPENSDGISFIAFYDSYGKEIKRVEIKTKGYCKIDANTENLASGIYSYSLIVNEKVIETKKMIKSN